MITAKLKCTLRCAVRLQHSKTDELPQNCTNCAFQFGISMNRRSTRWLSRFNCILCVSSCSFFFLIFPVCQLLLVVVVILNIFFKFVLGVCFQSLSSAFAFIVLDFAVSSSDIRFLPLSGHSILLSNNFVWILSQLLKKCMLLTQFSQKLS